MGTLVVGICLAGIIGLIVNKMIKDKKSGKTQCGGDCSKCRGNCH